MPKATWKVEVLSTGQWKGQTFDAKDLEEIAANFETLKGRLKVPLKFGHDKQIIKKQNDGDPALGWVDALMVVEAKQWDASHGVPAAKQRDGQLLIAQFSNVPSVVSQAVREKRYDRCSPEVAFAVKYNGKRLGKVLAGVALLGADLPAVDNLKDLSTYLDGTNGEALTLFSAMPGLELQRFSLQLNAQEVNMPDDKGTGLELSPAEVLQLKQKVIDLERENSVQKRSLEDQLEIARVEKYTQRKNATIAVLDGFVKENKILPAVRETLNGLMLSQQKDFKDHLVFTEDQLVEVFKALKPFKVNPQKGEVGLGTGEGNRKGPETDLGDNGEGDQPDYAGGKGMASDKLNAIVFTMRTANPGAHLDALMEMALASNPELAQAYAEEKKLGPAAMHARAEGRAS